MVIVSFFIVLLVFLLLLFRLFPFSTKPTKPAKPFVLRVGSPTGSPTGSLASRWGSRRLAGFPWLQYCFVCFDGFVT